MSVCLTDNKVDEIPEPDWAGLKSSKGDSVLKTPQSLSLLFIYAFSIHLVCA